MSTSGCSINLPQSDLHFLNTIFSEVFILKKALFLMHALVVRFGSKMSTATSVLDSSHLPRFLRQRSTFDARSFGCTRPLRILAVEHFPPLIRSRVVVRRIPNGGQTVVAALPKSPPKDGPSLTEEQACRLRAAAIDACEMIIEVAHEVASGKGHDGQSLEWMKDIKLPDIDMWLWAVAKDRPDYRSLERFVLRGTVMF